MNELQIMILICVICGIVLLIAIGAALISNFIHRKDYEKLNKEIHGKETEETEGKR